MDSMEDRIFERIIRTGRATFADLCEDVEGFSGSYAITLFAERSNIVIWHRVSKQGVRALTSLRNEGLVDQDFATTDDYEGYDVPQIPVIAIEEADGRKYPAVPSWLPMVLIATTDDHDGVTVDRGTPAG